jgi:hypothetical protein
LSSYAKTAWNRTHRLLDDMATEVLKRICAVKDGLALAPDAVNLAAELVATIRGLPWLV